MGLLIIFISQYFAYGQSWITWFNTETGRHSDPCLSQFQSNMAELKDSVLTCNGYGDDDDDNEEGAPPLRARLREKIIPNHGGPDGNERYYDTDGFLRDTYLEPPDKVRIMDAKTNDLMAIWKGNEGPEDEGPEDSPFNSIVAITRELTL